MKTIVVTGAAQGVELATRAEDVAEAIVDRGWIADASWDGLRMRTR